MGVVESWLVGTMVLRVRSAVNIALSLETANMIGFHLVPE